MATASATVSVRTFLLLPWQVHRHLRCQQFLDGHEHGPNVYKNSGIKNNTYANEKNIILYSCYTYMANEMGELVFVFLRQLILLVLVGI